MFTPFNNEPFTPTVKKPGEIVIHGHRAYRVDENDNWSPLDNPNDYEWPAPDAKTPLIDRIGAGLDHPICDVSLAALLLLAVVLIVVGVM